MTDSTWQIFEKLHIQTIWVWESGRKACTDIFSALLGKIRIGSDSRLKFTGELSNERL